MPLTDRSKSAKPRAQQRRRATAMARIQWLLGLGATVIVAAMYLARLLDTIEYPSLDFRAMKFHASRPPSSPDLAVVAIDDESLATIGRWPWPRERIAAAINELTRAGASVVALDIMLDVPQEPRLSGDVSDPAAIQIVADDKELAKAMTANGHVVLGASFPFGSEAEQREEGVADDNDLVPFNMVYARVRADPKMAVEELAPLIKDQERDAKIKSSPVYVDLAAKVEAARRMVLRQERLSVPEPESLHRLTPWPTSQDPKPPIPVLFDSAAQLASVSFGSGDLDGKVRRIPLWIRHTDRLYPTLGLAAAALKLGVPIDKIRVTPEWTVLPLPDGSKISLRTHDARLRRMTTTQEGLHYITWPRGARWIEQFPSEDEKSKRPFSMGRLLDISRSLEIVRSNLTSLDAGLEALNAAVGFPDLGAYRERAKLLRGMELDDERATPLIEKQAEVWKEAVDLATQGIKDAGDPATLSDDERQLLVDLQNVVRDVPRSQVEITSGIVDVRAEREKLLTRFGGKVVLVGWTATGSIADFVSTSIDPRTPGVLVHAAVINAILTRHALRIGPLWLTLASASGVLLLGVIGTLIGVRMGVVTGPIVLLAAGVLWFFGTGLMWDAPETIVSTNPPLMALAVSWLAVILHRLIVEQRGRKQTEARFRSYVSPDVVDILVNNPGMDTMKPIRRELTILFSDIAGWTTLSERLGTEGIGTFLRTYLKAMTEALQTNHATLDKYIGDGIMAFWGAPIENPDHARDAAKAAIEMMSVLDRMNTEGAFGAIGRVSVRVGLSTGEVSVGDFGNPPDKSSYTVIGDAANVAARLEAANRQFGTTILMTERTRGLIGPDILVRPVGRVVLKGKVEFETLYELIGDRRPRADRTSEWISVTDDAVSAYIGGRLEACLEALAKLRDEFGDAAFAEVYRHSIELLREGGGPPPGWQGTVVLTEK